MNVIQRPRAREFCGTMRDYIIDTDVTISFVVKYGGKTILEEEYVADANNQVRVRKLGQFCELALWGVWCAGDVSWQSDAAGTFSFLINGVEDAQSFVMFSRMQTRKDASMPGVLSEVSEKVTRSGVIEYASGLLLTDATGGYIELTGCDQHDAEKSVRWAMARADNAPVTVDVSCGVVERKLGMKDLMKYRLTFAGGSILFMVDRTMYAEKWCFRFKNVYDMPETLTCTGGLKLAGNNDSDTAAMWGVERKFGLKVTDEYTANSGAVMLQSDYKLWHNLLNAQEVDIFAGGEWLPVVITKQRFERELRRSVLKTVEFSFRMADPEQNNMIAYD